MSTGAHGHDRLVLPVSLLFSFAVAPVAEFPPHLLAVFASSKRPPPSPVEPCQMFLSWSTDEVARGFVPRSSCPFWVHA